MSLGDFGNMKDIFNQLKDAQKHVKNMQKELHEMRIEAETGAGIVKATVNGEATLVDIKIDFSLLEGEEVKALPSLIIKAVQEAQKKSRQEAANKARALGINLPGTGL